MKRAIPLTDLAIFAVGGDLLWTLGVRTHVGILEAAGGVLIGLAIASVVVGFSVIHLIRALLSRNKS